MVSLWCVLSLIVGAIVVWIVGVHLFAVWNLLPVAAAFAAAIVTGRPARRAMRVARDAFCLTALLLVTMLHLAWRFDWRQFATGSSTSGLIFIFAPLYTVGAAALVSAIAASASEAWRRR